MSRAVASSLGGSAYAELKTHVASISTSSDTHAPPAAKASATATCFASSRVRRRTRTFVSTACMSLPYRARDARLELGERPRRGRPSREERAMHVLRAVPPRAPHDDEAALLVP